MNARSKRKSTWLWQAAIVACGVGVAFASAQAPQSDPKKPGPKTPASAGATVNPGQPKAGLTPYPKIKAHLDEKPRKAIPNTKVYTLDDWKKMSGDNKATLQSKVTLNKQQVTVETYLNEWNKLEQALNKLGYTLEDGLPASIPPGGLKMSLVTVGKPPLAQQRAKVAADHHKTPEGKAQPFVKLTKDQASATVKAFDAARHAELQKTLAKANIERKTLTATEQKAFELLSSGKAISPADLAQIRASNIDHLGDMRRDLVSTTHDYHKSWKWSAGSADTARIDILGDLELSSIVSIAGGVEGMKASASLEADCFVLGSSAQKIIEIKSDFTTGPERLTASANVFGQPLFTPINKTTGDVNISRDYPFEVPIHSGGIEIIPEVLEIIYTISAQGNFNFSINGTATPVGVSVAPKDDKHPTAGLSANLVATGSVVLGIGHVDVEGTVSLVSDTLNLTGSVGVVTPPNAGPFLETKGEAHDTVSMLGGHIDLVVKVGFDPISKELFRTTIVTFDPQIKPFEGDIFNDDIKIPLLKQSQSNPGPLAVPKKK